MHELVERWYSSAFYPASQHVITGTSNLIPIAVLDVLVIAALIGAVALWWRARWKMASMVTVAAVLSMYVLFQVLWGLNYQRVKVSDKLVLDRDAPATADVAERGREAVGRLNALHGQAHAQGWREPVWRHAPLVDASARVQAMLGAETSAVPGRLKRSLFGFVFRWNAVDGMINPFGLDVLVNPDLLPFERPMVAAHEWAHLAGYADESEANFVGWLTCIHADTASQYSGWLYLYWQIAGELPASDREALAAGLVDGPRRDLTAVSDRLRRGEWAPLRRVSWVAYDQYLKANAVSSGVRSYGEVVTLLHRARFEQGWRPVRKQDVKPQKPETKPQIQNPNPEIHSGPVRMLGVGFGLWLFGV